MNEIYRPCKSETIWRLWITARKCYTVLKYVMISVILWSWYVQKVFWNNAEMGSGYCVQTTKKIMLISPLFRESIRLSLAYLCCVSLNQRLQPVSKSRLFIFLQEFWKLNLDWWNMKQPRGWIHWVQEGGQRRIRCQCKRQTIRFISS